MIDKQWMTASPQSLTMIVISAIGIYISLLVLTRLCGLRSFSKMSSFDFAITVAFGSVLASTILSKSPALVSGITALTTLYLIQYLVAKSRRSARFVGRLVDNEPLLLMAGNRVLTANLDIARITEGDLRSKLRMAGISNRHQVYAVVFESTGDVSVIRRDDTVDPWLLKGVRDSDSLRNMSAASATSEHSAQ
ncbi:DUF421 domain-containing protein [Salinisphaera aquimarina]|uniref:DUF421 domain-containing protein n=1 Tax=Salinisphaera aquimarina TaxID=2094031 RepID=A0ABV7ETL8_9GAMM